MKEKERGQSRGSWWGFGVRIIPRDGEGTLRGATSGLAPPPPQILTHLTSV